MTELQRIPCPYCKTLSLPHEALCPNCGKPVRTVTEKTVAMPVAMARTERTVVMSASGLRQNGTQTACHKGLNGRQKAFLWRYILPVVVFVPLYCLLVFLLKMPSVSVIHWLAKPLYRPSPGGLSLYSPLYFLPEWALVAIIDGAITTGIVRLTGPLTWQDLEEKV